METRTESSQFNIQVEKPSAILRKMTVRVPKTIVKSHLDKGLVAVQKTAKLKGFRPGYAPLSIIKQYYGEDVRHRVFHNLIDESFQEAVREHNLRTVGSPKIDTPEHKTGAGDHDHTLHDDQDLTYVATVEVIPEVEAKNYTGIALSQDKVEVTEEDLQKIIDNIHQSQGQLTPIADAGHVVKKGDFVDAQILGGIVTETGVQAREEMKGSRLLEIGAGNFIPGFEDHLVGTKSGETKTFRITFPNEQAQGELAGKEAEFTVTINEVKEKKLPALDEELVKHMGYESLEDLRTKVKGYLTTEKTNESERKVKGELLSKLIEKNNFEVPVALIEGQTRILVQDLAQEFKKQGYDDKTIQNAIMQDLGELRARAETQVRSSLILESVAQQEKLSVSAEDIHAEIDKTAESMQFDKAQLHEYYAKNPGKKDDLEFKLRQERTLKFLLDSAKIKFVSASEK
jgi:trigger factor